MIVVSLNLMVLTGMLMMLTGMLMLIQLVQHHAILDCLISTMHVRLPDVADVPREISS